VPPHSIQPYNCIPLQRAETRSRLLLGLGIGAGGLEKHEDVVAWAGISFGRRKRQRRVSQLKGDVDGMSLCYKSTYRCALDRISKLYDGLCRAVETLRRVGWLNKHRAL
jgi:hypothetical protein